EPEIDALPLHDRARAYLRLAEGGSITGLPDTDRYLDLAVEASADDPQLHAHVLAKRSHTVAASASGVREAEARAGEALPVLRAAGPSAERLALHGLGWALALRGRPIDELSERFRTASEAAAHITDSPEPVEGLRLLWRGHVDEARAILTRFLELSD